MRYKAAKHLGYYKTATQIIIKPMGDETAAGLKQDCKYGRFYRLLQIWCQMSDEMEIENNDPLQPHRSVVNHVKICGKSDAIHKQTDKRIVDMLDAPTLSDDSSRVVCAIDHSCMFI
ncbi:hypothetical protein CLF_102062 [Clonorchis sinensis]|uniref:Uncharacterized protein n=1 Tax=Clonorchis sinensis TaxID=79923 RepID=G7Y774_CLOSI|nr:hypothetical protein CLF_102062 [Clonorchis sinensis]